MTIWHCATNLYEHEGELMSIAAGYAIHPVNGSKEPIFEGWNWPAFFFGIFWCAAKGLWPLVAILFLLLLLMIGLPVIGWLAALGTWIYLGANGNELYRKKLISQGYLIDGQTFPEEEIKPVARVSTSSTENKNEYDTGSNLLKDLERLQRLREQGALTEEEFSNQKSKLLQ
jgi:hypothetical protein